MEIACQKDERFFSFQAGRKCAEQLGIDWPTIQRCVSDREGQDFMASIGDDTNSLRPRVSFIPTIQINGSQDGQKQILKNFMLELCRRYEVRFDTFANYKNGANNF